MHPKIFIGPADEIPGRDTSVRTPGQTNSRSGVFAGNGGPSSSPAWPGFLRWPKQRRTPVWSNANSPSLALSVNTPSLPGNGLNQPSSWIWRLAIDPPAEIALRGWVKAANIKARVGNSFRLLSNRATFVLRLELHELIFPWEVRFRLWSGANVVRMKKPTLRRHDERLREAFRQLPALVLARGHGHHPMASPLRHPAHRDRLRPVLPD